MVGCNMSDLDNIKLIISEIDGVITDGKWTEDEIGNVLYKSFQSKDFDAINELRKSYKFVFLSEDNRINYNMCKRRNIPFYWGRNREEKYKKAIDILHRYSCTPDNTLFIPSKLSDLKCCQLIPKTICPDDVGEYLKSKCWAEFKIGGGEGVLVELVYLLNSIKTLNV